MRERYRIRLSSIFEIPSISDEKPSHCVKSVRIRSYSSPYFLRISPYSVRMRDNTDENNSEYGHFSRSEYFYQKLWTWIEKPAISMEYHCRNFRNTYYFTCSQIKQDNGWYSQNNWKIITI